MEGSSGPGAKGRTSGLHPCLVPFLWWCALAGCAVATAVIARSALWLLLVLPALPALIILGGRIAAGHPRVDADAGQRFVRVLDGIEGEEETQLIVQDQTVAPCSLRRGRRPALIVARDFVDSNSDEVLRGVSGREYESLHSARAQRLNARVKFASLLLVVVGALLASLTAPRSATLLAALASVPLTMWLTGALAAVWSRSGAAESLLGEVDEAAAELVGSAAVIAALLAMDAWRADLRSCRSTLQRAASRLAQPVPASFHTSSRVERLRARGEAT